MEDKTNLMERKRKILRLQTQEEIDFECAVWSLEYLKSYELKEMPVKPDKVVKYHNGGDSLKIQMERNPQDFSDFWRDPEVMEYFENVNYIKSENKSNYDWLLFIKKVLNGKKDLEGINRFIATHEGGEKIEWSN